MYYYLDRLITNVENNYLSWDETQTFDKEMTACREPGGDCGDIQNKYAVMSADNRQKLHIDVAADPLTALSGEDKWNIEGGLSAAGRPGWLYGSLENQDVRDYVTDGNSYDLNYLNSNTSQSDRALAFFGESENYWGTVAGAGSLLTSSATLGEKVVSAGLSYGANGAVQIATGNSGDKFDYLSFIMSGLTGGGTPPSWRGSGGEDKCSMALRLAGQQGNHYFLLFNHRNIP